MILHEYAKPVLASVVEPGGIRRLLERYLNAHELEDLCAFLIDLNLPEDLQNQFLQHLQEIAKRSQRSLPDNFSDQFQESIGTFIPTEVAGLLEENSIAGDHFRESILQTAEGMSPEVVLGALLDNDTNYYELHLANEESRPLLRRLKIYDDLEREGTETKGVLAASAQHLTLIDFLTLTRLVDLSDEAIRDLDVLLCPKGPGLGKESPAVLEKRLATEHKDLTALTIRLLEILSSAPSDQVLDVLRSREHAMSAWFQTIGPNVQYCHSGVLHQAVPCLPGMAGIPRASISIMFPDFYLVIDRNGAARAHQIGPDGLASTPTHVRTIVHAYEGYLENGTVHLAEVSGYPADSNRPSLGDLELSNYKVSESGLEATFDFRGKSTRLRWDPGF